MMVLRTLLMIPSAMAFFESVPFSLSFLAMASWNPGLDDEFRQRHLAQLTQVNRRVGLNVRVEEVAHVRLVGLDVELLTRVLLDRRTDLAVELDLLLQRGRVGVGVAGFGQVLRDGSVRADKDGNGLVKRHPKRLGLVERVRVRCVPAEVVQELLHFAWKRYRLA